jgi:hypothetical protein
MNSAGTLKAQTVKWGGKAKDAVCDTQLQQCLYQWRNCVEADNVLDGQACTLDSASGLGFCHWP